MPGSSAESTDTIVEEGRSRSLDRKDTKKKKRKRYVFFRLPNKQAIRKKKKIYGHFFMSGKKGVKPFLSSPNLSGQI